MKMGIGESGRGGICGKEARRGESTGGDLKVEEAEKRKYLGLRSTQFVATMWRL